MATTCAVAIEVEQILWMLYDLQHTQIPANASSIGHDSEYYRREHQQLEQSVFQLTENYIIIRLCPAFSISINFVSCRLAQIALVIYFTDDAAYFIPSFSVRCPS